MILAGWGGFGKNNPQLYDRVKAGLVDRRNQG